MMIRTHSKALLERYRHWFALAAIMLVSVTVRIVSAVLQGDTVVSLPGINDQLSYDALARRVLAGAGFSFASDWWPATRAYQPTAHWSYPFTLYLAGVYALTGLHPLMARLIQATVAGVVQPWLVWRIGSRVFGQQVGVIAAALTAAYAYFVYYAGALITETFYTLAVLWMLDVAIRLGDASPGEPRAGSVRARLWLELGLAVGLAGVLRQALLLFVPGLIAWLLWRRRLILRGFLLSLTIMTLLIAPWTLRNYSAFGRFVLLNTNAGYAFFWANHPVYGDNFVPILSDAEYASLIPEDLRGLDEAALDQALLQAGMRFVADDPPRYLRLSASRIKEYFKFWPSSDSSPLSNTFRVLSFGISMPFILLGLLLALPRPRSATARQRRTSVGLLYLFITTYTAIHLLSWALIRYRVPVDAVLMLFAALAITHLAARLPVRAFHPRSAATTYRQRHVPARQGG
jgi:hypothetical protein